MLLKEGREVAKRREVKRRGEDAMEGEE